MVIHTAIFGPLDIDAQDVFDMKDGLLGFNDICRYALITRQEDDVTLRWFQAVDTTHPCFVVFDPLELIDGYQPEIERADLQALGCSNPDELSYLVIAVVPEDVSKTTVNLKSPIVLNRRNQTARQVVLANPDYPIRFPLSGDAE